ncbi:uncharacterized protein LOC144744578 [Ciona intestinalis]
MTALVAFICIKRRNQHSTHDIKTSAQFVKNGEPSQQGRTNYEEVVEANTYLEVNQINQLDNSPYAITYAEGHSTQSKTQKVQIEQNGGALQIDATRCRDEYVNMEVAGGAGFDIPFETLVSKYKNMLASNEANLKKQFRELATASTKIKLGKTYGKIAEHKKKNRCKNILPCKLFFYL